MHLPQALGLSVLLFLMAPDVNAAETPPQFPGTQLLAQASAQNAEARRQQAQAAEEEARKKAQAAEEEAQRQAQAAREAAEKKLQAEQEKQEAEQKALAEQKKEEEEKRAEAEKKKEEEEKKEKRQAGPEPKLNIPIRYFVYSAVFGGLGYATGLLSAGPERDLRNPAKHPNQDKTLSLYRRARYGGIVSKSFYGLSGAMGGYAAYRTQSAIREYLTAKAQRAALQKEANQRLAQAESPEAREAAEVTNALLVPPEPLGTELLVTPPEPPPLQAGFVVGPAGDASLSLSVRF